jgi:hypothetical protein
MQKKIDGLEIELIQRIRRPLANAWLSMVGLTIALTLGIANNSHADDSHGGNRDKIAEMTALVRHSEHCPEVPRLWATSYLMLLMMAPPTEEQVAAKEREMLALRDKIGKRKWCQLYSVEMEQAYIIYRLAGQR